MSEWSFFTSSRVSRLWPVPVLRASPGSRPLILERLIAPAVAPKIPISNAARIHTLSTPTMHLSTFSLVVFASLASSPAVASSANGANKMMLRAKVDLPKAEMQALIASKAKSAEKLSTMLQMLKDRHESKRLLQEDAVPELYEGDGNAPPGFGFDFSDVDLGDLVGSFDLCGEDNDMEFMGTTCSCSLKSTGKDDAGKDYMHEYSGIMDIIGDFSHVMENGLDIEFGCEMPTRCDAVGKDECSAGQVSCEMKIDTNDFLNSSFDCDTCVNYKNPPGSDGMPDESRSSMMTGRVLCIDVDMCSPTVASERSAFDNLDFDMSNILCGCTATLTGPTPSSEGEDCICELCDNLLGGVKLTCGGGDNKISSTCEETGLEFVNPTDISSFSQVKFAPQFAIVASDAPNEEDTSAGFISNPGIAYTIFVAALSIGALLLSSLA